MTQRSPVARGYEIVTRWRVLAEQRLDYLTELYDSGRWQRYFTREEFLANARDARQAVEAWRLLAPAEPPPEGSLALTWLDKPMPVRPRIQIGRYPAAAALDEAMMSRYRPAPPIAPATGGEPRMPPAAQLPLIDFSTNRVGS